MNCPDCGGTTRVIDTRIQAKSGRRCRRRECKVCEKRFTTHEVLSSPAVLARSLYIVINLTRGPGVRERYYVLGEEPCTYGSLEEVVECQAQMAIEFGHTVDSAPVYRLVPVPLESVVPLFERAKAELEREWREADVI